MYVKRDLTIALEALTICAGDCQGCFLTPEMRTISNFWSEEQLDIVGTFIKEMIKYHEKDGEIDDIGINFGQGDYLQLKEDRIKSLLEKIKTWTNSEASLFFTASGVTNRKKMIDNLKLFYDLSLEHKYPLIFDVVMNSSKIKGNIADIYEENLLNINKIFGYFNIHINMGMDVVDNITPKELKDILLRNNTKFIAINFLPTTNNNFKPEEIKIMLNWLITFMEISIDQPYKINYLENLQRLFKSYTEEEVDYKNYLADCIKNYKRNIFIDYNGNLFIIQEGFGDAPLTLRNNFKPILNIFEEKHINIEDIMNKVEIYSSEITKNFFIKFNKDNVCKDCIYQKMCMNTGAAAIKNIMPSLTNTNSKCILELDNLYNFINEKYSKNDYRNEGVFILKQKNLKESPIQNKLNEIDYSNKFNLKV